jgi:hypothetical protein
MDPTDILRNPKDPILKSGPELALDLLRAFGKQATGYPRDVVTDAAVNLILNNIREACSTRKQAGDSFDQLMTKVKELLLGHHYDAMGRRRNIFPYTQNISVPLIDLNDDHIE